MPLSRAGISGVWRGREIRRALLNAAKFSGDLAALPGEARAGRRRNR
jgi:hypothetical protein